MQQNPLPLPLPEPPAELVAQLLDELRGARRELREAHRLVALWGYSVAAYPAGHEQTRTSIEANTADHKAQLWAGEVRRLEQRARALGLDVSSQL